MVHYCYTNLYHSLLLLHNSISSFITAPQFYRNLCLFGKFLWQFIAVPQIAIINYYCSTNPYHTLLLFHKSQSQFITVQQSPFSVYYCSTIPYHSLLLFHKPYHTLLFFHKPYHSYNCSTDYITLYY